MVLPWLPPLEVTAVTAAPVKAWKQPQRVGTQAQNTCISPNYLPTSSFPPELSHVTLPNPKSAPPIPHILPFRAPPWAPAPFPPRVAVCVDDT